MNRKNQYTYEMFTQVGAFATDRVNLFPKTSAAANIVDALNSGVKTLSEQTAAIDAASRAMQVAQAARNTSRGELRTLRTRADRIVLALEGERPLSPVNNTDRSLIDGSRAFVAAVEPMRKDFAQHGLPLDTFSAAVDAMEEAVAGYAAAKASRQAAVTQWETTRDETLGAVHRMDSLVENFLADNPAVSAQYAALRTVRKSAGIRKAAAETPPAEPAPAPTAPSVPSPESADPAAA